VTELRARLRRHLALPVVVLRAHVDVGAVCDQDADHLRMIVRRCPHQRRLAAERFDRIHGGAPGDEQLRHFRGADGGGEHERGLPVLVGRVRIGPGIEQGARELHIPQLRRFADRGSAEVIRDVGFGACLQQCMHELMIDVVGRPEQRGAAVGVCRIHVDVGRGDRREHRFPFARADEIRERFLAEGRCRKGYGRERKQGSSQSP
jgi:hypothetical protein